MKGYKKQFLISLIVFSTGGIIQVLITNDFTNTHVSIRAFLYAGTYWLALSSASRYNIIWLDKFIPWLKNPLKRTIYTILSVSISTIIVVFFVDIFLDLLVLGYDIDQAIAGTSVSYLAAILVTLGINTILHGRAFLLSWKDASTDIEKLKTEQVKTQYQSLKNQVNPHFLFNSLNALSSLVHDDPDMAVKFIKKLSIVYRYVLDQKDEELVTISQEVAFTESFVFLQQVRFGENLKITIENNSTEGFVPPLAIQLLVENAIKHNVISDSYPLKIQISIDDHYCIVSNSIKEKISKDSTGVGISNLKNRYKYLTDKEMKINNDGDTFEVKLPILINPKL